MSFCRLCCALAQIGFMLWGVPRHKLAVEGYKLEDAVGESTKKIRMQ